jgi:hypothetical protein
LKVKLTILTVIILSSLAGCRQGELLTVDWQEGNSLEYKFLSKREINIDWDPTGKLSRPGQRSDENSTESLETVVEYQPKEIDPYGSTTIEARCKLVRVTRSKGMQKDAVQYLNGKTFTFTVGPNGKIEDYSQLDELLKETGEKAFFMSADGERIKEPDMISDFVATQWFMWDSISSLDNPSRGAVVGQSWKSQLSIPSPMVMRKARDVTYRLDEIRQSEKGKLAVISSSYRQAETAPRSWPIPYSGRFQMRGTFGFLSGYKLLELEGQGEEMFNIDEGRIEKYNQQYQMKLESRIPMGISVRPMITIKQELTMELVE